MEILTEKEKQYLTGLIQPYIGEEMEIYKSGMRVYVDNRQTTLVTFRRTDTLRFDGLSDHLHRYTPEDLGIEAGS